MALTPAQLATLKADIAANGDLNVHPNTPDGNAAVAALYNAAATPDFWVWRTSIFESEITRTTTADGTSWSWPAYIIRSQGERDAWARLFMGGASGMNPSLANVRQGLQDIFSGPNSGGTLGAPAQRTHLLAVSRRLAKRGEKLFATGTGSTASPAVMVLEGNVTAADVLNALAL